MKPADGAEIADDPLRDCLQLRRMKPRGRQASTRRRQARGVVLLAVLIATMALAFAGVALVRTVDTSVAIGSNLAMRRNAAFAASAAIERDVAALFETGAIADTTTDNAAQN